MTSDQFERLIGETRLAGAAAAAARLVLVDGYTQEVAAYSFSIDQSAVSRAVARVRAVEARLRELVRSRLFWCAGAVKDFPELVSDGDAFRALVFDAAESIALEVANVDA